MTQLTLQEARTHCPLSAAGLTGVPHPQIITCTRQLLAGSLQAALAAPAQLYEPVRLNVLQQLTDLVALLQALPLTPIAGTC